MLLNLNLVSCIKFIERDNPYLEPLDISQYKPEDRHVIRAIYKAFEELDLKYKEFASTGYNIGFPLISRPGACALVGIYYNNKLFFANLGDSQGIIIKNNPEKLKELESEFKDDSKVYEFFGKINCK